MSVNWSAFNENRPVYINYPFEDVAFRYEDGHVFSKFYGKQESEIPNNNNLYREAILSGDEISRDDYMKL